MGTPEFAVEVLREIHKEGFPIVGVLTAPDRKAGRGKKIKQSAVKEYALEAGFNILQPTNLKDEDFVNTLIELKADVFVVVAFRMLPKVVWSIPPRGTFNLHASLLPQYRGAAPINWAIINGETKTGVTTFLIDEKIDTGKLLFQEEIDILHTDNVGDLHDKLMRKGAGLVVKTLQEIQNGKIVSLPQDIEENVLLKSAPKIFKEDCLIDWSMEGKKIYDFIRGLSPYPGAYTFLTNAQSKKFLFKILEASWLPKQDNSVEFLKVTIHLLNKSEFKIETKDAYIFPKIVQLEGKKKMAVSDFLRGINDFKEWNVDFDIINYEN